MFVLEPVFLWAGLLALPLIALYTVRRERPAVGVPSLLLWRDVVAAPAQRRRLFGVLDANLLGLLLLLLTLASVVLGLARVSQQPRPAREVVAVVDVSGRMNAPGRLPQARRALAELAAGLGERDRLWVVTAGQVARVTWAGRSPPPGGWAAVTPAEHAGVDLTGALRLARTLTRERPSGAAVDRTVWVWSATPRRDGVSDGLSAGVALRWSVPPPPAVDLALTGELRASDEGRLVLRASVTNLTSRAAVARAVVRVEGLDVVRLPPVQVPAGARVPLAPQVLERARRTERVEVRLAADDLPHDDVLTWIVPALRPLRVSTLAPDRFVRAALAADGRVEVGAGGRVEVASAQAQGAAGRLLLGPETLPAEAGLVRQAAVAPGPARTSAHPVLRGVDLDGLLTRQVVRFEVSPGAAWRPIAWSGETPLVWVHDGAWRSVFVAVRPGRTDLVLRRAFPILIANAVRWLARDEPSAPRWVRAGRVLPGAGRHPDPGSSGAAAAGSSTWPDAPRVSAPRDPRLLWVAIAFGLLLLEAGLFLRGRSS